MSLLYKNLAILKYSLFKLGPAYLFHSDTSIWHIEGMRSYNLSQDTNYKEHERMLNLAWEQKQMTVLLKISSNIWSS